MSTAPYTSVFWFFFASWYTNWLILFFLELKCYVTDLREVTQPQKWKGVIDLVYVQSVFNIYGTEHNILQYSKGIFPFLNLRISFYLSRFLIINI